MSPDSTILGHALAETVTGLANRALGFAITLAVVGAIAMAILEAIKSLGDAKTRFNAFRFTRAFRGILGDDKEAKTKDAYAQLIGLCTGVTEDEAVEAAECLITRSKRRRPSLTNLRPGAAYAAFAQDATAVAATLGDAVEIALASPLQYSELFDVMTAGADQRDVALWVTKRRALEASSEDRIPMSGEAERVDVEASAILQRDIAHAYARLRQIAMQKLAGYRLYTDQQWAWYNQIAADILGCAIMFFALVKTPALTGTEPPLWQLFLLSLVGGVLAPLAKDIVGVLKQAKGG